MKILVANIGSTSFKYRLFDFEAGAERLIARGAVDRIGSDESTIVHQTESDRSESQARVRDHGEAVDLCLKRLAHGDGRVIGTVEEIAAIGFKAVHAKGLSGVQLVDDRVLEAMEAYSAVTPAHNPPYIQAMRSIGERFPSIPLIAAFETGFHQTIPDRLKRYAVPTDWAERHGVLRWGFHGASHRWIAERTAELLDRSGPKIISCHLGGSSSLCAIDQGTSVATTMGMSPQSGLPQNNRVGDLDVFALPAVMKATQQTFEELLEVLANHSGLLGLSGSNDLRDIEQAADQGDTRAQLALDVYITSIRHYLGAYLIELGGLDALVFTGGIGENSTTVRRRVCEGLEFFGLELDPAANGQGSGERRISTPSSRVQVWIVPTNEEIVVARQTLERIRSETAPS